MKKTFWILLTTILFLSSPLKFPRQIHAQIPSSFSFNDFTTGGAKIAGLPFQITITALDQYGAKLSNFSGVVNLIDSTNTLYPSQTTSFTSGQWIGNVYVTKATTSTLITASYSTLSVNSESFAVTADSRIKFLTITSGNNQTGAVSSQLPNPLALKVVDPFNNPISNVGVNFSITSAPAGAVGQQLGVTSDYSNSSGTVATTLVLGRKAGTYIVAGTLASGITNTVVYYESATHDLLTLLTITPAVAVIPTGGYVPFKASGIDQYENDVPVTPTWSVVNGGGTIDSTGVFYGGDTQGTYLNTIRAVSGSIGATATINLIGTGVQATSSATPAPTAPITPVPTIPTGVLNQVVVDPSIITALKDARIPIIATGVDSYGNAIANVNFTFQVSGTLGSLTQTAPDTVLLTAAEGGIGTVTVTATQGNIVKVAKIVGSVGTGLNRRLIIEPVETPQHVGEPFTLSIAAKDTLNNFLTDYAGPIVLTDTTGTIDPAIAEPNDQGIWYVQAIIHLGHPQVSITVAGDGMIGVSNIFEVQGEPQFSQAGVAAGAAGAGGGGGLGGLGEVMGASISAKLADLLKLNKFSIVRYIAAGLAAGLGILGASIGGGIMASRGLEAIGRNPFAKAKVKANLYLSIVAFIIVATLAVLAAFLIVK